MISQNRQAERDRHQAEEDIRKNPEAEQRIEDLQRRLTAIEDNKLDRILELLENADRCVRMAVCVQIYQPSSRVRMNSLLSTSVVRLYPKSSLNNQASCWRPVLLLYAGRPNALLEFF